MATQYKSYGVNLSKSQINKINNAAAKGCSTSIRLTKKNVRGDHKLPLTQTQVKRLENVKTGVDIVLSTAQLKTIKMGGFLPLLTLIPLIAGAIGAAGAATGGISAAVSAAKSNAEQQRHNRAVEEQLLKSGTVSPAVNYCNDHEHFEMKALDEVFNFSIDSLFKHCLTDSPVYRQFTAQKPLLDFVSEPWPDAVDSDGQRIRNISYTLSLTNPLGPKTAATTEKQIMYAASKPGEFYLVDAECSSPTLPYADSFYVTNRYCLTRISSNTTRLHVTSRINYRKSVWGFVKGILDKNVSAGVAESFGILASILRKECSVSGSGAQNVGAVGTPITSGSASSLRHRRTESKSAVKSPVHGLLKQRDLFGDGGILSPNFLRVGSRIIAILLILLVVCNIFLLSRLWSTTIYTTSTTATQSVQHISARNDILDDSLVSDETHPPVTAPTDRFLAIQVQLSHQQRELDHMRAMLQALEISVSEMKDTLQTIVKSVKQK